MSNNPDSIDITIRPKVENAQQAAQQVKTLVDQTTRVQEQALKAEKQQLKEIEGIQQNLLRAEIQRRQVATREAEKQHQQEMKYLEEAESFANRKQKPMGWGVSFSQFLLGTGIRSLPGGREGVLDDILMGASSMNSVVGTFKALTIEAGGAGAAVKMMVQELGPMTLGFGVLLTAMKFLESQSKEASKALEVFFAGREQVGAKPLATSEVLGLGAEGIDQARDRLVQQRQILMEQKAQDDAAVKQFRDFGRQRTGFLLEIIDDLTVKGVRKFEDDASKAATSIEVLNKNLERLKAVADAIKAVEGSNAAISAGMRAVYAGQHSSPEQIRSQLEQLELQKNIALLQSATNSEPALAAVRAGVGRMGNTPEAWQAGIAINKGGLPAALKLVDDGVIKLTDSEMVYVNAVREAQKNIPALTAEINALSGIALPAAEQLATFKAAQEGLQNAEEERAKQRAQLEKDFTQTATQIGERTMARQKQIERETEQNAIDDRRAAEEKALRARIDAAKQQQEERDRADQIAKLRREAAQADAKATREFNQANDKAQRELDQGNTKALRDYNERVDKINADWMANELKALDKFRQEEAKRQRDYEKEYARFLEDWYDRLNELAADRDVAGFIQEKKEGEKKLRRMAEDASQETADRAAAYANERQQTADNRAQQLADLLKDFEQTRADRLADFEQARADRLADFEQAKADRAADLEARIQQELDAGQKRKDQAQRLEDELAALREQWALEDRARRQQQEADDFGAEMATLKNQHEIQIAELNQFLQTENAAKQAAYQTGFTALDALLAQAQNAANSWRTQHNLTPDRFQSGLDYVPRDWFPAYLDRGERVLTAAENLAYSSGRGGRAINLTINYSTADLASKADVYAHGKALTQVFADGWRGISG